MADVQWTGAAAEELSTDELRQYGHLAVTAGELGRWQWDLDTREIQCSARAASLLGLPGAGTLGPDVFVACFDPVDQGKVALVLDDAAEGQEIAIEATLTKPYGVKGRLRLVATASRDAGGFPRRVLGLLIPMDHPTQIEETSRWLAAIVASSDDAIISKTVDGIVTSWNRGAERVFGYTADEMVGNSISVLAVPGHEKEMPAILERLRRGEKVDHYETTRRHKDGTIRHISLTVSPIHDEKGRVVGLF